MDVQFGMRWMESYRSWRTLWRWREREANAYVVLPSTSVEWQTLRVNFSLHGGSLWIGDLTIEYADQSPAAVLVLAGPITPTVGEG